MATAARVCLLVTDAVVVAVTIYHTHATVKASRRAGIPAKLSSTLLQAGKLPIRLYIPWYGIAYSSRRFAIYQAYSILGEYELES